MHIRAVGRLATISTLALLALPAAAHAVVEDFETPVVSPDGTEVSTQFRSSNGIYFTANLGASPQIYLPRIASGPDAKSPTRMLDITTDPSEFPTPGLEGRFDTEVTDLTVPVRNLYAPASAKLRLVAYGSVSGSKSSPLVTVPAASGWVNLTVPTADPGNGYSRFQVLSETSQAMEIRVDDIEFTPDLAAEENFSLLTEDIGGVVMAGQPKQYTINIQRLNGFAGNVTLSGSSTVVGETISFSPNPVSGTTSSVTITPPANAPERSEVLTVTGNGSPGTRTLEIPFVVETPFRVTGASSSVESHRCATGELDLSVIRNRFFDGPISLRVVHQNAAGEIPPDLDVSVTPSSFTASGATVHSATVMVTRNEAADAPAPVPLRVIASSGSVERSFDFNVLRQEPRLTSIAPLNLFTPQSLLGGSGITIRGNGLCDGAQIEFGNDWARVPGTFRRAPTADDPTRVELTATTPRLATSGPIRVINPSGYILSSTAAFGNAVVNGYRNRFGFSFPNEDGVAEDDDEYPIVGAGSLRDWQELLGPRQTNLNACEIGAIFPGCWEVTTAVPSPAHGIMQTILGEASYYNRGGTCVGLAIASRRIAMNQVPVLNRPAGGLSAPVWSLERSGRETIPGRTDIPFESQQQLSPIKYAAIQHTAQTTAEYIRLWAQRRTLNAISGPGPMRTAIEGHLRAGRRPLLNINYDGGGHAVNVYDVEDRPGGGYFLRVYDNNFPYETREDSEGGRHADRTERLSRIEITPGGSWTAEGLRIVTERNDEGEVVATEPRTGPTGDLSWIAVENELPIVPTSLATLDGWRVLATPTLSDTFEAAARAAQDADSGLLELGYLDGEGSMLTAESGQAHSIPVNAARNGRTELGIFGEGAVAEVEASGGGSGNQVLLPKGGDEGIGFRARGRSARVGLTLVSDKAGRMLRLVGARRGTTRVRFVGKKDRIQIVHNGASGNVRLELASFAERGRTSQFTTTLRLGKKGKASLSPRWKRLGNRIVARSGGRRLVLRNRAKPPVRVKRVGLRAGRKGTQGRATVRAKLRGKLRRLQALVVRVDVTKGKARVGRTVEQLGTDRRTRRRLARGMRIDVPLDAGKLRRKGKLRARAIVTASAGSPLPVGSSNGATRRMR